MELKPQSGEKNPNTLRGLMDKVLQYGTTEELQALFESGEDINQTDYEGRTALQVMSFKGKKDAVEMLLARGADINIIFMYQNRIPMTALDAARESKKNEIVTILLAKGAKAGSELRKKN